MQVLSQTVGLQLTQSYFRPSVFHVAQHFDYMQSTRRKESRYLLMHGNHLNERSAIAIKHFICCSVSHQSLHLQDVPRVSSNEILES